MASDTNNNFKVPKDLLTEILFRLSVESLVCAKCVCKQWFDLIGNHDFILNHLDYQKFHNKGRLLLQYFKEDTQELAYALFDDENLLNDTYEDLDYCQIYRYTIHLEGPINGVYCIFNRQDRIILWNPALMEIRTLPLPQTQSFPLKKIYEGLIGFGIDLLAHFYKVVLIRTFLDADDVYVTVYNLSTNSWKLLDPCGLYLREYEYLCESKNTSFLNGVYYWWTSCGCLIAFDMGEETFRRILGPDRSYSEWSIGSITTCNDKVSFLHHHKFSIDIWMMPEEGVWIKQFSVTSLPQFFWDIGLWKNDNVFVSMDGYETDDVNTNFRLVLCNANTQEMRNVGPKGMPITFRASIYYESLVSLDFGTDQKGEPESLDTIAEYLL